MGRAEPPRARGERCPERSVLGAGGLCRRPVRRCLLPPGLAAAGVHGGRLGADRHPRLRPRYVARRPDRAGPGDHAAELPGRAARDTAEAFRAGVQLVAARVAAAHADRAARGAGDRSRAHLAGDAAARVAAGRAAVADRAVPRAAGVAHHGRVGPGRADRARAPDGDRPGAAAGAVADRRGHARLGRPRAEPDRLAGRGAGARSRRCRRSTGGPRPNCARWRLRRPIGSARSSAYCGTRMLRWSHATRTCRHWSSGQPRRGWRCGWSRRGMPSFRRWWTGPCTASSRSH